MTITKPAINNELKQLNKSIKAEKEIRKKMISSSHKEAERIMKSPVELEELST